jgi:hypothetical protein
MQLKLKLINSITSSGYGDFFNLSFWKDFLFCRSHRSPARLPHL